MAVLYGQVTVPTSATLIYRHAKYTTSPVIITNLNGSNALYVGGDSSVTSSNYGHRIAASNGEQSFQMNYGDELWGLAAGGTSNAVAWIVTGA